MEKHLPLLQRPIIKIIHIIPITIGKNFIVINAGNMQKQENDGGLMEKDCPICGKVRYNTTLSVLVPNSGTRAIPGLTVKCSECDFKSDSLGSMIFGMLFTVGLSALFIFLMISQMGDNLLIIPIIVILMIITSYLAPVLFIPFISFKDIHKEHCNAHTKWLKPSGISGQQQLSELKIK